MVALNFAINTVLSGGSDAEIIGKALEHLRDKRGFVGTVSVTMPNDRNLTAAGDLVVVSGAGRFFIPRGKTLSGAWNVSDGAVTATNSLVDVLVPGDGTLYARDHGLSETLIGESAGLKKGVWVQLEADALWLDAGEEKINSAALWNLMLDTATSNEDLALIGRAISDRVADVPTWHFLLGLSQEGSFKVGKAFAELKLGRALEPHEEERVSMMAKYAEPRIDLWVSKETGYVRQVALTYLKPIGEAVVEGSMEAVVVTFNVSEYPEWEDIEPPASFEAVQVMDEVDEDEE